MLEWKPNLPHSSKALDTCVARGLLACLGGASPLGWCLLGITVSTPLCLPASLIPLGEDPSYVLPKPACSSPPLTQVLTIPRRPPHACALACSPLSIPLPCL